MSNKNYIYIDYLRAFAIFCVILLHCICDYYVDSANIGKSLWYVIGYINELARVGVPIFLMISGFLILGKDIPDIKAFYKKRILKIGIPALCYDIFYYLYMNISKGNQISFGGFFADLFHTGSAYHLWYIYTILLIYLMMPFLNVIIKNCNGKKLALLFALSIFQTTIRTFINTVADGNFYVYLADDGFNGYIGYVILGYILGNYNLPKIEKNIIYSLSLTAFIITPLYSMQNFTVTGNFPFIGGYSINHYIEAAGLFLWCREHITNKNRIISKISALSFSMYLIHVFFLEQIKPIQINLTPSCLMTVWFVFTCISSLIWGALEGFIKNRVKRILYEK